jgi:hypothetical protein
MHDVGVHCDLRAHPIADWETRVRVARWAVDGSELWFGRRPWRRSALTVEPHLIGLAQLGDGDGCIDHCGHRKPCANRSQQ